MGPGFHAAFDAKPSPLAEFEKIATAAGHDMSELEAGLVATAYLRVGDIHGLRFWMSHAAETARAKRRQSFSHFGGRARLWQGVHDRGEAYIFAAEPLDARDVERMSEHFPARLKVVSAKNIELAAGAVLDVSATAEDWDVGTREELYTLFNVGTLTIGAGARVIVQGNVFSMVVQHVDVRDTGMREVGPLDHHIGILPTPHPVDSRLSGPLDGPWGSAGSDGQPGRDGSSMQFRASVFGPAAIDPSRLIDDDGKDGASGLAGQAGRRGRTGGMCKTAEITIRSFAASSAPLKVFCQAGQGGRGGRGGKGGDGGRGGNAGRQGAGHTENLFGKAGKGGDGGDGGHGGNGGNGGISSNVFVSGPPDQLHLISVTALESLGGPAGKGGAAGKGGMPGNGAPTSAVTASGLNGQPGTPGLDGRGRPKARMHINEILKP